MEKEHAKTVLKFLKNIKFKKSFSFLDVGCGNGWAIRYIAQNKNCKKAIGIDKSKNMIKTANLEKISAKEHFFKTDLRSWKYSGKFDYVFSMESLYYSVPMEPQIKKIYRLLKKNGKFFCGTDFYKENKATVHWAKKMRMRLDLRSKSEWKKMFWKTGFKVATKQVKDTSNSKKWKREFGTLFIIGKKLS
jgi:SAM-dependent methyltransferase